MSRAMKEQHLRCNLRRGGQEWPPVERSVVPGGGRGGGGTTLGLDLHSPVRISDFVVAAPTVFADRWLGGGDCDAPISRHMAMAAYRPGGGGVPPAGG